MYLPFSYTSEVIGSQVDQSLAVSSRPISPESMDPAKSSVRDISTLLGFGLGGMSQTSETYSRKVFVGGLPQEVDEGIETDRNTRPIACFPLSLQMI